MFNNNFSDYSTVSNFFIKAFLAIGGLIAAILIEYVAIYLVSLRTSEFPYTSFFAAIGIISAMTYLIKSSQAQLS